MNRNFFWASLFLFVYMQMFCAIATDIDTLKSRMANNYLNSISITNATNFLASQASDGSWSDIDYTDTSSTSWIPVSHLQRLKSMAAAFQTSSHAYYRNPAMRTAINKGLSFWYSTNPISANWWFNTIGKQIELEALGILMEGYLDAAQNTNLIGDLTTDTGNYEGQNGVWIANQIICRGCLENNATMISTGVNQIQGLVAFTSADGIQYDYSFDQHGALLYNGGYGVNFINDLSGCAYLLNNTGFAFSSDTIKTMTAFLLEGCRWMTYYRLFDYSALGRNISRPDQTSAILVNACNCLAMVNTSKAAEIYSFRNNLQSVSAPSVIGNRLFPYNDFMTHIRNNYYFSVKMNSKRTFASETVNNENLKGKWLSFGVNFICCTGNEYDNIMPVWDWARLPGVTNPYTVGNASFGQSTNFVGGVSDGQYGVAAMELNYEMTHGKKSWFLFDNEIVALGADINSSGSNSINTTINQCLLNGLVTVNGTILSSGEHSLSASLWVHHDNVGYIFPVAANLKLKNQAQTGCWYDINNAYSATSISENVFTLWFDHGVAPSNGAYQYIIVPNSTSNATSNYAGNIPVRILSNTSSIQAVRHDSALITGMVFYSPGSVAVHSNLTIRVDKPCILLLNESTSTPTVKVSSPGNEQLEVNVELLYENSPDVTLKYEIDSLVGFHRQMVKFNPVADSYLRGGLYTNNNYGAYPRLIVKKSSGDYDRKSVVKFDISALKHISNAKLRLYCSNLWGNPTSVIIQECDEAWAENTITHNNAPTPGNIIGTNLISSGQKYFDWDVSAYVGSKIPNGTVSFYVYSTDENGIDFYSRENGSSVQPELIIKTPLACKIAADSYVRGGAYANINAGQESRIIVKGGIDDNKLNAYIKFYTSGIRQVSSAKLRLYCSSLSNGPININVHKCDNNWTEDVITYNNAPAIGEKILSYGLSSSAAYVEFDVSSYVQESLANGVVSESVSFAICTDDAGAAEFSSLTGLYKSELIVDVPFINPPNADSYVRGGNFSSDNYGGADSIMVKRSTADYDRKGFLKFDLSSVNKITNATLRMQCKYLWNGASLINVFGIQDVTWGESSINYNTQPVFGGYINSCYVDQPSAFCEWDITAYVQNNIQNGMVSLGIYPESPEQSAVFSSKNGSENPPELIINRPETIIPTDDSFVRGGIYGNNTAGSGTVIIVNNASLDFDYRGYMKFDISKIKSVSAARLRIYCNALWSDRMTVDLHKTSDGWNEGSLSYNNAPAIGALISSCIVDGTNKYFEWDVTSYLQEKIDAGVASFAIYSTGAGGGVFDAKEGLNSPALIVSP